MIKVEGLHGVSATVICDSISEDGVRLLTYELEYPRIILAEQNTHRMLSKNSASSRAIPFAKMSEQLTGRPVRFGQANPGMQDKGVDFDAPIRTPYGEPFTAAEWWEEAKKSALDFAKGYYDAGYHKQVYNRLTEAFQMMKTVLTGTELENYFWLRNHGAADPTIAELARCMYEARGQSTPQLLKAGEWHLPYVHQDFFDKGDGTKQYFYLDASNALCDFITLEDAIKVSCARCAAVSFRNVDYGIEKSREVFERLVGDERKHASALEHQATPMEQPQATYANLNDGSVFQEGVSHMDKEGRMWSGNFRGWVQYRKLVNGENKEG